MSWGKKPKAWEIKETRGNEESVHLFDVALGIAIGVAATLLCIGILRI